VNKKNRSLSVLLSIMAVIFCPQALSFDLYYCQVEHRITVDKWGAVNKGLDGFPSMFRVEIFRDKGILSIEGSYFNGGTIRDPVELQLIEAPNGAYLEGRGTTNIILDKTGLRTQDNKYRDDPNSSVSYTSAFVSGGYISTSFGKCMGENQRSNFLDSQIYPD
jgi:hypothetical protein